MTREEAIEVLENGGWWDLLIPVTTIEGRIEDDKLHEALDLAITALRPVSRERVEKVWRGEWKIVEYEFFTCTRCGDSYYNGAESTGQAESYLNSGHVYDFCPNCGAPMTDEAVQMVMERMEELKDD